MKSKKSKLLKIVLLAGVMLLSLVILARLTGALQFYRAATPANEPNIKVGSYFLTSNLKKPKRFDFLCYRTYVPVTGRVETSIYRVCGTGGDKVALKNGILFINDVLADSGLSLRHLYRAATNDVDQLIAEKIVEEGSVIERSTDSSLVLLDDRWVRVNKFQANRFMVNDNNSEIVSRFSSPWTTDNFGPAKVPVNHFFLLGDSRHNAYDSRFRGFVSIDSIIGTVVWRE
ncbi:MAG: signal peptidase I [Sphingobacteriales bacterium]|nr:MAG: signal peptidase I [Sphingobacteriales bacterium]